MTYRHTNSVQSTSVFLLFLLIPATITDLIPEIEELEDRTELQLKPICLADVDCPLSSGMICSERRCKCRENYFLSGNECLPMTCSDDFHCSRLNNTECIDGHCLCSFSYEYNLHGQCQPLIISSACAFDLMCPGNSVCINNQCKCKFGTALHSEYQVCSRLKCSRNRDCIMWPNSICQETRCHCGSGYYLDTTLQRCISSDRISVEARSNFLMQNIFAIVIVCNFFLWVSIFVLVMQYTRRRRLLVAAQRATLCNERLPRLPRGAPPPPPSYDYQNYRTQAQLAPPPYSIDDPAKPPEYSTVISTIDSQRGVAV